MTDKQKKATEILTKLNEAAELSEYGRYVSKADLAKIIRVAMFGEPKTHLATFWSERKIRSRAGLVNRPCKVTDLVEDPMTDEQTKTVAKVIDRMIAKGVIKVSKSGWMVKPMMTAEEWIEKNRKES